MIRQTAPEISSYLPATGAAPFLLDGTGTGAGARSACLTTQDNAPGIVFYPEVHVSQGIDIPGRAIEYRLCLHRIGPARLYLQPQGATGGITVGRVTDQCRRQADAGAHVPGVI